MRYPLFLAVSLLLAGSGCLLADNEHILHVPEDPFGGERVLLTKENQFPEAGKWEIGGRVAFGEFDDEDEEFESGDANTLTLQADARYTIRPDLTLNFSVPLKDVDVDNEPGGGTGFGDISLGAVLKAHETITEDFWVLPHATLFLPTGDEDDGLGFGETRIRVGTTFGRTVWERWHTNAELGYEWRSDIENAFILSASTIWEFSDKYGVSLEGLVTDEEIDGDDNDHPALVGGGMYYDWSELLRMSLHGTAGVNGSEDALGTVRFTYHFD